MMNTTTSADGTPIAYTRSGEGSPLVLVHGTTADHSTWGEVIPILAERFTVYAMDRRGRGKSGDADEYAIEREFEDIKAVADESDEPVYIVGHSHGALCTLGAGLLLDDLRGLVLYEPPFRTDTHGSPPSQIIERMEALAEQNENEAVLKVFFRDVLESEDRLALYRSQPSWPMRIDAALTVPREFKETWAFRPSAADLFDLTAPTLLILGGKTSGPLEESTRGVHELLPKSELAILEGEGHAGMYGAPERLAGEIRSFCS